MSDKVQAPVIVPADAAGIARAATILREGGLVVVPTETVYGLAARADSPEAVAAIYRAKGRPDFNPLIVHVPDVAAARGIAEFDARAEALAEAFWSGALTLVLPLRADAGLAKAVTAGLQSVALRCPAHPVMRALLAEAALPLAAPSANRSGAVSPTRAEHVALGAEVGFVLDGGTSAAGIESTIVALRPDGNWQLLRPGPIDEVRISTVLGRAPVEVKSAKIEAPGQLARHYSPGKPLRLDAQRAEAGEFMIGFGAVTGQCNLSPASDLSEAASRLYDCLHQAAAAPEPRIAVAPIPTDGIGGAINDRLRRAAA